MSRSAPRINDGVGASPPERGAIDVQATGRQRAGGRAGPRSRVERQKIPLRILTRPNSPTNDTSTHPAPAPRNFFTVCGKVSVPFLY